MKRCLLRSALALCACLLAAPLPSPAAPYKAEYKLSVVPGATSGWGMTAAYFADLVRERSQGRINIKVYPSSQLLAGKQTSEFLMLRNGAIDFALASTINWSPQIKELNLTALPFFLAVQPDRYKAMDAVMAGKSGKMMVDAIEKKGVKIIGWAENGFREMTTSKGPISKPEDMSGLKIRVVGSPIFIETFRALGANPVNMNWSEATTGFQQGVVDGQENHQRHQYPAENLGLSQVSLRLALHHRPAAHGREPHGLEELQPRGPETASGMRRGNRKIRQGAFPPGHGRRLFPGLQEEHRQAAGSDRSPTPSWNNRA